MGVQGPQLVRLLGEGLRVLMVHLGEQNPDLPGQSAQEEASEEMGLLLTPGQISSIWDMSSEGFLAPSPGNSNSLSAL